jgi:hypothetical protein
MMELHAIACYYTGRREEGSKAYWQMRSQIKPGMIDEHATKIIMENEKHFLPLTTLTKQTPGAIPAGQPTQRGSNYTPPKKNRKRR